MKHVSDEDFCNIQVALIRNYGYFARKAVSPDDGARLLEVIDDSDRAVTTTPRRATWRSGTLQ
jgi:hypothetical protein